ASNAQRFLQGSARRGGHMTYKVVFPEFGEELQLEQSDGADSRQGEQRQCEEDDFRKSFELSQNKAVSRLELDNYRIFPGRQTGISKKEKKRRGCDAERE